MRLVLATGEGLNAAACDRLMAGLLDERTIASAAITIDLQSAETIDPYGAACLTLIARQLVQRGQHLTCVMPATAGGRASVARTGLAQTLRELVELRNLSSDSAPGRGAATLPLSAIRTRSDVQAVLAYLVGLTQQRLGFDAGDVLDATKVVSELCYNVIDHSGGEGLVVAQLGRDRRGQRYVALAVADAGIGIRASLSRRYAEAGQWPHGQAIERALSGLSSRPAGGGAGLRSVVAIAQRYQGRLAVRSGSDRFYVAAGHLPRILTGAFFPGTQVGVSFSQRI